MTTCSAHVLDASRGRPAQGVDVSLTDTAGTTHTACTDADGQVRFDVELGTGRHTLHFATGPWFTAAEREHLHPEVLVSVTAEPGEEHLHVGLLLGPFTYTVFREEPPR